MWETNSDRKGEGERANNSSGAFIPRPVFIRLSQYQVVVVAAAVSVFFGHGGKNDNVAIGGGGNGVFHHGTNDDVGDYQSHC